MISQGKGKRGYKKQGNIKRQVFIWFNNTKHPFYLINDIFCFSYYLHLRVSSSLPSPHPTLVNNLLKLSLKRWEIKQMGKTEYIVLDDSVI